MISSKPPSWIARSTASNGSVPPKGRPPCLVPRSSSGIATSSVQSAASRSGASGISRANVARPARARRSTSFRSPGVDAVRLATTRIRVDLLIHGLPPRWGRWSPMAACRASQAQTTSAMAGFAAKRFPDLVQKTRGISSVVLLRPPTRRAPRLPYEARAERTRASPLRPWRVAPARSRPRCSSASKGWRDGPR